MDSTLVIAVVAALIGGGGIAQAISVLSRRKPDRTAVLIDSAEDVVVIQRNFIGDLETRIEKLTSDLAAAAETIRELQREVERLKRIEAEHFKNGDYR